MNKHAARAVAVCFQYDKRNVPSRALPSRNCVDVEKGLQGVAAQKTNIRADVVAERDNLPYSHARAEAAGGKRGGRAFLQRGVLFLLGFIILRVFQRPLVPVFAEQLDRMLSAIGAVTAG